jgi:hypothetical protein
MMFRYVLQKIEQAGFRTEPFRHRHLSDLFDEDHFQSIVACRQIRLPPLGDDRALVNELEAQGYQPIPFPGTTTDVETYLAWHGSGRRQNGVNNVNCEGFGITYRLMRPEPGSMLAHLDRFLRSDAFWQTLAAKFGIDLAAVETDSGIQKYLDGCEISPHPDVRRKALTFMVNINPAAESETLDYHTHTMRFRPDYEHVRQGWATDLSRDRGWVSWDWCETVSQQRDNNSMVIFAPADDTLHAVRASYDHLRTQRTQCYGNLWFRR